MIIEGSVQIRKKNTDFRQKPVTDVASYGFFFQLADNMLTMSTETWKAISEDVLMCVTVCVAIFDRCLSQSDSALLTTQKDHKHIFLRFVQPEPRAETTLDAPRSLSFHFCSSSPQFHPPHRPVNGQIMDVNSISLSSLG